MKALENAYLTKDEVINALKDKYDINLSRRMLKYYGSSNLIEPGIVKQVPGIRGSVSLYKEKTPELINFINILVKHHGFTLKKVAELSGILSFKNEQKLEKLYSHYNKGNKNAFMEKYDLEVIDFERFSILRALFELGRKDSEDSLSVVEVDVKKDEDSQFKITVTFFDDLKKTISFGKEGVLLS